MIEHRFFYIGKGGEGHVFQLSWATYFNEAQHDAVPATFAAARQWCDENLETARCWNLSVWITDDTEASAFRMRWC